MTDVSVRRLHGLGNVVQLLPILRTLAATGVAVELVTRPEWAGALARLAPEVSFRFEPTASVVDLDAITMDSTSTANRTREFMDLLGVRELRSAPIVVPAEWLAKWNHLAGAIVLAPEAAFSARQCPPALATAIGQALADQFLVVVGRQTTPDIACAVDLRGTTTLEDLFGIVANSSRVICMDSAMLHLAMLLDRPTVALFGGISPESRTQPDQRLVVLVGDVPCRPCNKNETCGGAYYCLHKIGASDVTNALAVLVRTTARSITVV